MLDRLFYVFCGLAILQGIGFLSSYYLTWAMEQAVVEYGWGRVPPAAMPNVDMLTAINVFAAVVGGIGSAIVFVMIMVRAGGEAERSGITGYRRSNFWTVVTLFIPLVNLVRPWLGFAEIWKSIWFIAVTEGRGGNWRRIGFSWQTFAVAFLYMIYAALGGVVDRRTVGFGDITVQSSVEALKYLSELNTLQAVLLFMYCISALAAVWYLNALRNNLAMVSSRTRDVERDHSISSKLTGDALGSIAANLVGKVFPILIIIPLYFVVAIGLLYWLWISIQIGSFVMFIIGVIPPFVLITAPIGAWALLFGVPDWLLDIFA